MNGRDTKELTGDENSGKGPSNAEFSVWTAFFEFLVYAYDQHIVKTNCQPRSSSTISARFRSSVEIESNGLKQRYQHFVRK
jgi:hypothetical protein